MQIEHTSPPLTPEQVAVQLTRRQQAEAQVSAAQQKVSDAQVAFTAAQNALASARFELLELQQVLSELT